MTFLIDLEPETAAQLRALAAARGEDPNHYAAAALAEAVNRDLERALAEAEARVRALDERDKDNEGQALLTGPARPLEESFAATRAKYGIPDLSHLSREELAEQAEAILAALPPEKIAEAERLGLI
jgi:hypothetical protein